MILMWIEYQIKLNVIGDLSKLSPNLQKKIKPNVTVFVKTGQYNEILPIIVPADVAVVGDELRSTEISAATAGPTDVNDANLSKTAILRMKAILSDTIY